MLGLNSESGSELGLELGCIQYTKLLIQYIKLLIQYTINWVAFIPERNPFHTGGAKRIPFKYRRPKATKKAQTKTSKISKTSIFYRFFIFEVLVSFPHSSLELGRKPKPPNLKNSLIVISCRGHKTKMFFVPRAKPEVRNISRFMVECVNVMLIP